MAGKCNKEDQLSSPYWPLNFLGGVVKNSYAVFVSNFGMKSPLMELSSGTSTRILVLFVFMTGNVMFMAYRASLTSELSVRKYTSPFNNFEELLDSDYRYCGIKEKKGEMRMLHKPFRHFTA